MPVEKKRVGAKDIISDIMFILLGSALYGSAIVFFLGPSGTIMGGATGIATTVNIFFPQVTIGTMIFVANVPLLLIGLRVFGLRILWRVIIAVFSTSLMSNLLEFIPFTVTDDPLLCAIMGGLLLGAGGGLLLSRGYNSGGSDLAAVMLRRTLLRAFSTGRIIFGLDLLIVVGSALLTRNYTGIFYSLIATYAYSFAIDYIIDGNKTAKMTFIISDKYEDIADGIFSELSRGVTLLNGLGWYSGSEKHVILCVVKPHELFRVKALVKRIDPAAFMILTDAKEVAGLGFEALE